MNEPWYLSRAAGIVAYLLIFATVSLGIAIRTRGLDQFVARWRVTDIHRFLSILTIFFVVIHVTVLLWDQFVGYSITQVLVPFASPYRPFWTSLGIISAYLLVIVSISFSLRRFTGYRFWRGLHYATYALYFGALAHGIFTGTDSTQWWAQLMYVVTAGTVLGLLLYRLMVWQRTELKATGAALLKSLSHLASASGSNLAEINIQRRIARMAAEVRESRARSRVKVFAFAASAALGILLIGAAAGPFKWFHSGSGYVNAAQQVQSNAPGASGQVQPNAGQAQPNAGSGEGGEGGSEPRFEGSGQGAGALTDSFTGTLQTQQEANNTVAVSLVLDGTGNRAVRLNMALTLQQDSSGNTTALSNTATLTDASTGATICSGQALQLDSGGFAISCSSGSSPMQLIGQFTGADASGHVSGTLQSVTRFRGGDDH